MAMRGAPRGRLSSHITAPSIEYHLSGGSPRKSRPIDIWRLAKMALRRGAKKIMKAGEVTTLVGLVEAWRIGPCRLAAVGNASRSDPKLGVSQRCNIGRGIKASSPARNGW